ncbi:MAG: MCP four helix bundle domain-containing protein [Acidobacteriia bacterium]|nr:MCP four helix bundle domain-containing protein [Terriglobia bacterium]
MESSSDGNRNADRLQWSSRFTLVAGFGGLLAIVALAGVDALRVLQQIRRDDDQIRRQFLARNHVLNDIRSQLYLSGTYVRDYLLEPDAARATTYRANLQEVRGEMESALASYARQVEPEAARHYGALKAELSQYWQTLDPILNWDAAERRARGYIFLRDAVFPRRRAMLEIAGRIADINEQQLNAGNERVVALLHRFQNRLAATVLATLALGLGMAAFSARKILRLETHAQARYREVADARRQLTNLSGKLVQAQETERRALSRELHDEVGQALSAVLVELRNLATGLAARSEEQSRSQVELIKGLVENTVRVVRNMALLLRPSMLDDLGLIPALRWQAREVSKRTSMDVSVATDIDSVDLPDDYKTCIYRVVQEALHNCSRHSDATTVRIRVQQKPGRVALAIQDDGRGFDVRQSKGLGLLGIEERVARLGGACEVHSAAGSGTILSIELPFPGGSASGTEESEADSHSVSG